MISLQQGVQNWKQGVQNWSTNISDHSQFLKLDSLYNYLKLRWALGLCEMYVREEIAP
jgi:hypothetical protein